MKRKGLGGCWGAGDTLTLAMQRCKKAGGSSKAGEYWIDLFVSTDRPFRVDDREPEDGEPEAYVEMNLIDGTVHYQNCERIEIRL